MIHKNFESFFKRLLLLFLLAVLAFLVFTLFFENEEQLEKDCRAFPSLCSEATFQKVHGGGGHR